MIAENFKDAYEDNNKYEAIDDPSDSYSIIRLNEEESNEEESIHMHAIAFINAIGCNSITLDNCKKEITKINFYYKFMYKLGAYYHVHVKEEKGLALEYHRKALEILLEIEKSFPNLDPRKKWTSYMKLGDVCKDMGNYEESKIYYNYADIIEIPDPSYKVESSKALENSERLLELSPERKKARR